MATKLAETAESRPLVAEHLADHKGWQRFAAERLQQAHKVVLSTMLSASLQDLVSPPETFDNESLYNLQRDRSLVLVILNRFHFS